MINVPKGIPAPLRMQLDDGVTDRFIRVVIYDVSNTPIGSVELSHVNMGMYVGLHTFADTGFYNLLYTIYLDSGYVNVDEYYRVSSETYQVIEDTANSATAIAEAVWNNVLDDNTTPGSAAVVLKSILVDQNPESVAGFVWNALAADYPLAGSFGLYVSVIRQFTQGIVNDLASNSYGLLALKAQTINTGNMLKGEIDQNETKIDLIIPAITSSKNAIISQVDENQVLIEALGTQATQNKSDIVNEINQNETKIDAVQSSVNSLSNNTTTRFIVPELLIKPETGTKTYQFHLRLFDSTNNPEAPDIPPTIRIRDLSGGVDIVNNVPMTQDGVKVGAYYYVHTISAGSDTHPLLVEATVVEEGKTRYIPAVTEVTEYGADLDAIQTQLGVVNTKVTDTQTKVNSGVYGLQAIRNAVDNTTAEVLANRTLLNEIKIRTDALPASVASQADIAGVNTAISALPRMQDISAALELIRSAIMGTTNKSNTDVYNHFDISSVAKTNDPRFTNLDAKISTRSVMTAADVWTYAQRTLTSVSISTADMRKIWEVLATDINVAGSFGKLFQDMLDAKVSSRATSSQVQSLLAGVAQQTTLVNATSQIIAEVDANEVKINSVLALLNAIKPQTDKIVTGNAQENTLNASTQALTILINNLALVSAAIRSKTDTIPANPAKEASVLARPTNPVLATDPRLNNLDAPVSSRSTLTQSNLNNLASEQDINDTESRINSKFNTVNQALNSLFQLVADVPTNAEFAYKIDPLSTTAQLAAVATQLLNAIGNIQGGGGSGSGVTAADIWAYAQRSLTTPVTLNTTQYEAIAKTADGVSYEHKISTIYKNDQQEVMVWSEKNGERKVATDCSITVKNADGDVAWSASADTANAAGVFKFVAPIALTPNTNYMVIISAVLDGAVRTTQQSFFTVG